MFDIVAIGEVLIDFTPSGKDERGIELFGCNPGGAPANVLAMACKLKRKTAFIGKVGNDKFGAFLEKTMKSAGINTDCLKKAEHVPTTLAFVHLDSAGDRTFSFYRKPGADITLNFDEIDKSVLQQCKIFHFGSVSLTDEPARSATISAVKYAKHSGAVISYDPNYRPLLWQSEQEAKAEILNVMPLCDIVKVSDEELAFLTDKTDILQGAKIIANYGARLVIVTKGKKGAFYYTNNSSGEHCAYDVKTIDTTGAGDCFLGALLHCILNEDLSKLQYIPKEKMQSYIDFANAAGSLATMNYGAILSMPTLGQITNCQKNIALLIE